MGLRSPQKRWRTDRLGHFACEHWPRATGRQNYEVRYEAKKTGRSAFAVKKAVKKVGTSRKRIERGLGL
ncbi:DUF3606 domain-containing protein [Bradyrhizobium sp. WSM 1744]|uniref:DUF3606 domain-containing protein n=1 Tax=Bradyrhizobium archetypum TaxID=2721160 RepID=A0A7Y4H1R8_9BRAD|nr:DUF3606 domain-containing protein [Bradyrhizobium archetypum]